MNVRWYSGEFERRGRRGSALVMALVTLLPLMVMGMMFMAVGVDTSDELSLETDQVRAQYLAEAALAEAVTSMRYNHDGSLGSADTPAMLEDGLVWVEATPMPDDLTRLLAVGMKGKGRSALDVVVRKTQSQVYRVGFVSNDSTNLSNEVLADSYDSDLGTYASQVPVGSDHAGNNAFIASNGDIVVEQHSTIYGDVRPGASGTVTLVSATVSGSTAPVAEPFVMEPVVAPVLPAGTPLALGSTSTAIPPGEHRFESLSIGSKGVLSIPGPATIVIDGDVQIGSGVVVEVGTKGPVEIYVGGDMRMGTKSSFVTPSMDPNNVALFLTGEDAKAELKSHTGFYGIVYGPDASIELDNGFEMFGSLAARHYFAANNKLKLHFDEALMRKAEPWAWEFQTLYWNPASFPVRSLMADRRDPMQVLELDAADLTHASECWKAGTGTGTTSPTGDDDEDDSTTYSDGLWPQDD